MEEVTNKFYNQSKYVRLFFLSGSISDLTKLDFSPFHVKCCYYNSSEAREFYTRISKDEFTERAINDKLSDYYARLMEREELFVLIPQGSIKKFSDENSIQCRDVLLLMFPSLIGFKYMIDFKIVDDKYFEYSSSKDTDFKYSTTGDFDEEFLYFHDDWIQEINSFIQTFAKRINTHKYLKTSMNSYISSFQEMNPVMAFLSLCITLESTVNGFSELTYRIGRNVSILVNKDMESAEQIFDSIKVIYDLRSKIINGSDYQVDKVYEFLPYIRVLASCTLVKLFQSVFTNKDDLNKMLTFSGFDRNISINSDEKIKSFINDYDYGKLFRRKLKK